MRIKDKQVQDENGNYQLVLDCHPLTQRVGGVFYFHTDDLTYDEERFIFSVQVSSQYIGLTPPNTVVVISGKSNKSVLFKQTGMHENSGSFRQCYRYLSEEVIGEFEKSKFGFILEV